MRRNPNKSEVSALGIAAYALPLERRPRILPKDRELAINPQALDRCGSDCPLIALWRQMIVQVWFTYLRIQNGNR
jgi:hypothetical protein